MTCTENLRRLLSQRPKKYLPTESRLRAGVLIPIYIRNGHCHIVFTRRTETVAVHKGQISFPGGGHETYDKSMLETALRESEEEVGIMAKDVTLLGELDDIYTWASNFIISPFVGTIPWPYPFCVDAEEVDEIIEVPIAMLLDKNCLTKESQIVHGEPTVQFYYHCLGVVIWGVTAKILNQFLELIVQAVPEGKEAI